jgi:hypothetical protein
VNDFKLYLWIVLGVLLSVFLPLFIKWLKEVRDDMSKGEVSARVWEFAKPYVKVAVASAAIAFVALAILRAGVAGEQVVDTWAKAFLFGYVADSTIQKFLVK